MDDPTQAADTAPAAHAAHAPHAAPPAAAARPRVHVLNGPNLNLLGRREPHLYGHTTLAQIQQRCLDLAERLGLDCRFRQTNHEGELVDWIQQAFLEDAAVVINPAGLSFGRVPVFDALKLLTRPLVEVHLTNIHQRPEPHRHSLVSQVAHGVICGLGPQGYLLALQAVAERLAPPPGFSQ